MEQNTNQGLRYIEQCPVCGHRDSKLFLKTKDYFLTGEEFNLVQCNACSFVYTNPVPDEKQIFSYYDSPEYNSHALKKHNFFNYIYERARRINIRNKYRIISGYKKTGNILDVGCGTGELLKYFRDKRWQTAGIEPVKKAREFAINQNNLQVYTEEKLHEFNDAIFDVITMWHVLEHVYKLNERIEELKRILKPDGVLIVAVPMINAYDAFHYGPYWGALDVPRHLYHFSKKTLMHLLEKHELAINKSYPMKMDAYYVSLLSERYKHAGAPYLKAFSVGFRSNSKAAASGTYSSMIFAVQKN